MDAFLRDNNKRLVATEDEKYEFVLGVVTGQLRFDVIVAWIASHMREA